VENNNNAVAVAFPRHPPIFAS